jgi:hypothetical protein
MNLRPTVKFLLRGLLTSGGLYAGLAGAQDYNDGHGHLWRQLTETQGLSWQDVAARCPVDGHGACSGSVAGVDLTGWTWGNQSRVMDLFNTYLPASGQLSNALTSVSGRSYYDAASDFITLAIAPTNRHSTDYSHSRHAIGWIALQAPGAEALRAIVDYRTSSVSLVGTFQAADALDPSALAPDTGFWLWREATPVPEPHTALLLAAGLAALRLARHRVG